MQHPAARPLRGAPAPLALLLAAACGDPAAPGPPRVRAVRIDAPVASLQAGATLPLRAVVDADPGADTTVRWTSAPSTGGSVSEAGLVTSCYPGGMVIVVATSVADPTKADTVELAVTIPPVGWAEIGRILRAGTSAGEEVSRGAVSGDVELEVRLNAGVLHCRGVERAEVRLQGPGIDSVIARVDFAPPLSERRVLRVPFRAGALANGVYELGGALYLTGLPRPERLSGGTITVRNP